MSELVRTIIGRLREFIGNRRSEKRSSVRLPLSISVLDLSRPRKGVRRPQSIKGHTCDISPTRIALMVPAIRIGAQYLADQERRLQIKLELPGGPVEIQALPLRYERIGEGQEETGYLIGVQVVQMNEQDRSRYNEYLAEQFG